MKNMKLMYNNFVPDRPEQTTLLELWCLIGGVITAIFIASDSGMGFSATPKTETILSLVLPALYFYINYLARYIYWMRYVLISTIILGLLINVYLLLVPDIPHQHAPYSFVALILFSVISLFIILTKRMRS